MISLATLNCPAGSRGLHALLGASALFLIQASQGYVQSPKYISTDYVQKNKCYYHVIRNTY